MAAEKVPVGDATAAEEEKGGGEEEFDASLLSGEELRRYVWSELQFELEGVVLHEIRGDEPVQIEDRKPVVSKDEILRKLYAYDLLLQTHLMNARIDENYRLLTKLTDMSTFTGRLAERVRRLP